MYYQEIIRQWYFLYSLLCFKTLKHSLLNVTCNQCPDVIQLKTPLQQLNPTYITPPAGQHNQIRPFESSARLSISKNKPQHYIVLWYHVYVLLFQPQEFKSKYFSQTQQIILIVSAVMVREYHDQLPWLPDCRSLMGYTFGWG